MLRDQVLAWKQEMENHLREELLPFWITRCWDEKWGVTGCLPTCMVGKKGSAFLVIELMDCRWIDIIEFPAIGKPEYLVLMLLYQKIEPMLERLGMEPLGYLLIDQHCIIAIQLPLEEGEYLGNILCTGDIEVPAVKARVFHSFLIHLVVDMRCPPFCLAQHPLSPDATLLQHL